MTMQEVAHFGDALVNLGNQGASTESEIIEITKRFAAFDPKVTEPDQEPDEDIEAEVPDVREDPVPE